MDFWNLLFGGRAGSWTHVALLACLFRAALGQPERIRSVAGFRIACLYFALALIAPTLVNLYVLGNRPVAQLGRPLNQDPGAGIYLSVISPVLFMISFMLAIDSVMPRRKKSVVCSMASGRAPRARRSETAVYVA